MMGNLLVGEVKIEYIVKKSSRVRHVRIDVLHDGEVHVIIPNRISFRHAHMFVHEKRHWILQTLNHYKYNVKNFDTTGWTQTGYHACKGQALRLVKNKIVQINSHYNFNFKRITVRNQKSKWGSCSSEGNLNFNYKILFLPDELCDYIVSHELCHLGELNHSQKFWKLVQQTVPDYKMRRHELKKYLP